MTTPYTITTAYASERSVTLLFNGKLSEDAIPVLEHSLGEARAAARHICLDLSEVTLVDRKAVEYLSLQAERDVKLVNCPIYLRRWITQGNEDVEN